MDQAIFSAGFRERPYWLDALPQPAASEAGSLALPARADVVVVGAGLTGLAAAWELARAGRSVVVLDAGAPGEGASSRNAGMLGRNFKHSFTSLMDRFGLDTAKAYFQELQAVYLEATQRIEEEGLDCAFRRSGRLTGALSPQHFERLVREYELRGRHLGEQFRVIEPADAFELGTQRYHGGIHIIDNATLQPAAYARAMLRRARAAGALVIGHCRVHGLARDGKAGFEAHTALGKIRCRDVLVATNGYSQGMASWVTRRLIPIHAYMVATEPLPPDVLQGLLPARRTVHDNRRSSNYMQLSPDGQRLLFGGRTGSRPANLRDVAAQLHEDMVFHFPQLRHARLSHAWTGRCAATGDLFPHVGVYDGMHYALGYCFSGNAMAPYLGVRAARHIMGAPDAGTMFGRGAFPTVPWLARQPGLMPILMRYYQWADRPRSRAAAA